jgi:hypothetical protein
MTLKCPRCGGQNIISETEQNNLNLEVIKRKCPACFTAFYLLEDILIWMGALNSELATARAKAASAPK